MKETEELTLEQQATGFLLEEGCGDVIINSALRENKENWKYVSDMIIKFHQSRLPTILTELEDERKEAELLKDIWEGDGRPQYNEGYENAMKQAKSIIQQHLNQ